MWKSLIVLALTGSGTVLACDLDDCALPAASHLERSGAGEVPSDRWAWMNHDLALARDWMADGEPANARQIALALDAAMRAQLDELVRARGAERVAQLHQALAALVLEAGGPPLDPLVIEAPAPRRTRARLGLGLARGDAEPEPEPFVGEPDDDDEDAIVGGDRVDRSERRREREREREGRTREASSADRGELPASRDVERPMPGPRP